MTTDRPHQPGLNGHRLQPQDGFPVVLLGGVDRLLTAIPHLLGFQPPPGSMVLLGLRQLLVGVLLVRRIPTAAELVTPDDVRAVWGRAGQVMAAHGCDSIVVIAYTDTTRVEDLLHVLDATPLPVEEAVRVENGRWWNLECTHPSGCTRDACASQGQALPDSLELSATLVALGHGLPGTPADLEQILTPEPPDVLDAVAARLPLHPAPNREALYAALADAHTARHERPLPIDADLAAVLLHGLADTTVRDACLAWDDDAAWWLWSDLIRTAPHGWVAPVATVLAVHAYRRGDGMTAAIAAEHALLDQPDFSLARLLLGLLDIATTPGQFRDLIDRALAKLPPSLRPDTTT